MLSDPNTTQYQKKEVTGRVDGNVLMGYNL